MAGLHRVHRSMAESGSMGISRRATSAGWGAVTGGESAGPRFETCRLRFVRRSRDRPTARTRGNSRRGDPSPEPVSARGRRPRRPCPGISADRWSEVPTRLPRLPAELVDADGPHLGHQDEEGNPIVGKPCGGQPRQDGSGDRVRDELESVGGGRVVDKGNGGPRVGRRIGAGRPRRREEQRDGPLHSPSGARSRRVRPPGLPGRG